MRVGHAAFDALARQHVARHADWAPALLPLVEAREMLYQTFMKLQMAIRVMARKDAVLDWMYAPKTADLVEMLPRNIGTGLDLGTAEYLITVQLRGFNTRLTGTHT